MIATIETERVDAIDDREFDQLCTQLLRSELQVAMGCTEPIAIAYCAAYATQLLGRLPERYEIHLSGNIIKNVKAVSVPKTGGCKGIEAAVLAGAISGRADLELEVLSVLREEDLPLLHRELGRGIVDVQLLESEHPLHILLHVWAGGDAASVEIVDEHTGIGRVVHNGTVLHEHKPQRREDAILERRALTVERILEYADRVDLDDVREVLERQIACNTAMSAEGLRGTWGECVSKALLNNRGQDLYTRIKAAAAAGSEARMNGCAMPVVINSGSGNQGMTASLPVIEYAQAIGATHEQLLRALCVSNLMTIHQKTDIGRLSAYCGVVCAATGAASGIAYLDGQSYLCVYYTITNSILNVGGMVCDGAKSSCAAKIVSALESALLAYDMAKADNVFRTGEGLAAVDVERTITNIGRMASRGMVSTDKEILNIMIGK